MDESTRVFRDREDIRRLVVRYAHAIDNKDLDALMEVFAPDARLSLDSGGFTAEGAANIRARFVEGFAQRLSKGSAHSMSNVLIDVSGDSATVNTFAVSYLPRGEKLLVRGNRYADTCCRRDGEWKISERNHVGLWQFTAALDASSSLLDLESAATKPSQAVGPALDRDPE